MTSPALLLPGPQLLDEAVLLADLGVNISKRMATYVKGLRLCSVNMVAVMEEVGGTWGRQGHGATGGLGVRAQVKAVGRWLLAGVPLMLPAPVLPVAGGAAAGGGAGPGGGWALRGPGGHP